MKTMKTIVFFDIETTGLNKKLDRIVEISLQKYDSETQLKIEDFTTYINPSITIPQEASEIHGINNFIVKDSPKFYEVANKIHDFIGDNWLAGFNSISFDVPFLFNEFERVNIKWNWRNNVMIDVGNIFKNFERRTLEAAVKFYLDEDHTDAHMASTDVEATAKIFFKQLEKYSLAKEKAVDFSYIGEGKPVDVNNFFIEKKGEIYLNFSTKKGNLAKDDIAFLKWMLDKDFPSDTHDICHNLISKSLKVN